MDNRITIGTIERYLLGDKDAVRDLMQCRHALWVGLVFVFSAGFAREYDAESLLHEPWYLLIPLAASLFTSFVLYGLLYSAAHGKGASGRGFWELYPTFLTLYWLTAPLAWLYAIPVERFLPPLEAAQVNYAFLAIVSVWRVLLITRAASVMFSAGFGFMLAIVLLFADTVVVVAAFIMPKPIFDIMGGVQLSDVESLTIGVSHLAIFFGVLSWPLWLIGMLACFGNAPPTMQMPVQPETSRTVHRSAWMAAAGSLVVWLAVLPFTQTEQVLRYRVERELKHGDLRRGLQMMSARQSDDFPPNWSPPPRWSYRERTPKLHDVLTMISFEPVADWVAARYWKMAESEFEGYPFLRGYSSHRSEKLDTYIVYLERHPERERVLREASSEIKQWIATSDSNPDPEVQAWAEQFQRLLESVPSEPGE